MKKYKVKINGKTFNVVLESVEESNDKIEKEKVEEKIEEKDSVNTSVFSPIQGTVIDIKVKVGQKVKKGDVILLIEAMKLENEINAVCDGEIAEILVEKGQTVTNKQVLVRIK